MYVYVYSILQEEDLYQEAEPIVASGITAALQLANKKGFIEEGKRWQCVEHVYSKQTHLYMYTNVHVYSKRTHSYVYTNVHVYSKQTHSYVYTNVHVY